MKYDHVLDALGLLCPLPVLKARKRIAALESGQVLRLLSDDPAAVIDVPHFCNENGHRLLKAESAEGANIFFIQKK